MNYVNKVLIGTGSNGTRVYKVFNNDDGKYYAMKKTLIINNICEEKIINEINIFNSLKHENIIKYYDSFIRKNKLYIIMEIAEGGDLKMLIKEKIESKTKIDEETIWKWFGQLCSSINYIHKKNILHRDIKPGNVFLTNLNDVKLGDFGISKILETDYAQTGVGTPFYFSPEMCKGERYGYMSDMWMIGCLLYELCTLKKPYYSDSINLLINDIINKEPDRINDDSYSRDLINVIEMLLIKNPDERLNIKQIIKNENILKRIENYLDIPLQIPKLHINIEDNYDKYKEIKNDSYFSLSPFGNLKTTKFNHLKRLKNSPLLSPKHLEFDEDISLFQDINTRNRNKSHTSTSTSTTNERNDCLNSLRGHYKHLSINIKSMQSSNDNATYEIENIVKKNLEFPKLTNFLTPTYVAKKNLNIKNLPNSTKDSFNKNRILSKNSFKQYLLNKFGDEICEKLHNLIKEDNYNIDEEKIKKIVGKDYDIAITYARYLFE